MALTYRFIVIHMGNNAIVKKTMQEYIAFCIVTTVDLLLPYLGVCVYWPDMVQVFIKI